MIIQQKNVRAQILELLNQLVEEFGFTLLFISHDLGVVRQLCTHVAVMHEGEIIEQGATADIWQNPQYSYTQTLLSVV